MGACCSSEKPKKNANNALISKPKETIPFKNQTENNVNEDKDSKQTNTSKYQTENKITKDKGPKETNISKYQTENKVNKDKGPKETNINKNSFKSNKLKNNGDVDEVYPGVDDGIDYQVDDNLINNQSNKLDKNIF